MRLERERGECPKNIMPILAAYNRFIKDELEILKKNHRRAQ